MGDMSLWSTKTRNRQQEYVLKKDDIADSLQYLFFTFLGLFHVTVD